MTEMEAIYVRRSVRTFEPRELADQDRDAVNQILSHLPVAPFKAPVRMALLERVGAEKGPKLGTYGFIKGASHFISGTVATTYPMALEDFAYVMERVILRLTSLGLGSCWLGASFRKGAFDKKLLPQPGEIIPAVTPVGYAESRLRLQEVITRRIMKPLERKPMGEMFFLDRIGNPLVLPKEQMLPFELVRLAPSAENHQPWRIVAMGDCYHFYLARSNFMRRNSKLFGNADMERLDMGIAMAHFEIGAENLAWHGTWKVLDPEMPGLAPNMEYRVSYQR